MAGYHRHKVTVREVVGALPTSPSRAPENERFVEVRLAVHDHTLEALDKLKVDDLDKSKLLERVRTGEGKPKARAAERTTRASEDLYFPKRLSEAWTKGEGAAHRDWPGFWASVPMP